MAYSTQLRSPTPLSPEARNGLIPTCVTVSELNELEQKNIGQADSWAFLRKRNVLDEAFIKGLHKRMFKSVWRSAGTYRKTETNLGGIAASSVTLVFIKFVGDMRVAFQHKGFEPDELALGLSHRLVSVHPFPNGNRTLVTTGWRFDDGATKTASASHQDGAGSSGGW